MDTRTKGDISEAMVIARFLKEGWQVFEPVNSNGRIDLLLDRGNGYERIQVKTARIENGVMCFAVRSTSPLTGKTVSYVGDIDLFAAYSPELDEVYLVPVHDKTKEMHLYFEHSARNRKLADDYLLGPMSPKREQLINKSPDDLLLDFVNDPNYEINADGSVFSIYRGTKESVGYKTATKKIIYYKRKKLHLDKAVFLKFKGCLPSGTQVIHLDGDENNCAADNLTLANSSLKKSG